MTTVVWLVHWTGGGAIVCVRNLALYARVVNRSNLTLAPVAVWLLAGAQVTEQQLNTVAEEEVRQSLAIATRRLQAVGRRGDATIRNFTSAAVYYDPHQARENWLGDPVQLRDRLTALAAVKDLLAP